LTASNHHHGYSDQPTTRDELGFAPSAEALLRIVHSSDLADTPLTIGIFGPWGSGKTSLMQMILDRLDSQNCVPVWFDAWRYAQSDALWRALLVSVIEAMRVYLLPEHDDTHLRALIRRRNRLGNDASPTAADESTLARERTRLNERLDDLIDSLYRTVDREELGAIEVDWKEAGKLAARTAVRLSLGALPVVGIAAKAIEKAVEKAQEKVGEADDASAIFDIFKRERSKIYRDQVQSLEQFYRDLKQLAQEWIVDAGLRLVVFVDDLDRCLPEQAIGVLEAIKVFLDIRGCIFVLGVDREIIERGIRVRYKEFALDADAAAREGQPAAVFPVAGRDYLEKIVQVPFELPPLERAAIERFLQSRLGGVEGLDARDVSRVAAIMTAGLLRNPRKVKRTFNTFRLLLALGQAHGRPIAPALLAKLVVIQSSYFKVYEQIARRPAALRELERQARDLGGAIDTTLKETTKEHPLLKDMLYQEPFFDQLGDEQLSDLVFWSQTTQDGRASLGG
jgi:hypothetical protein